jgi:MFS family permease
MHSSIASNIPDASNTLDAGNILEIAVRREIRSYIPPTGRIMQNATGDSGSLTRRLGALPRPAWVICIGMFINKFGNFLSVFLVLYLTAKGYSTFLAGLALGAVGLGSFFGNAIGGYLADRLGRRSAIVVSMFGTALFTILMPFLHNYYLIVALALLIGFFGQIYRPAGGAILVDTTTESQRVTAFALLRLAINLGMSVGPLVGGLLSGYSYTWLFVGNAVTSLLFGLLVLLLLPETRPTPAEHEDVAPDRGYREVFADRALVLYLLSMIAGTYAYVQTTATLPLHVKDVHLSNTFYGLLLGINALMCVCIELPLVRFTERRNSRQVIAVGLVLLGLGVGLIGVADSRAMLVFTVVVWTFAEMIYTPVATAYPGLLAPSHLRGRYQAAEGIAITLAQTAGPAIGGLIYGISQGAHWLTSAALSVVAAALILAAKPRRAVDGADSDRPEDRQNAVEDRLAQDAAELRLEPDEAVRPGS